MVAEVKKKKKKTESGASEAINTEIFKMRGDRELTWTGFKPGLQSVPRC